MLTRLITVGALIVGAASSGARAEDWSREVGGWDVGRSGDACIMIEDYEGEGSTAVALMTLDDPSGTSLMITNGNWSTEKDQRYELRYHLGEWVYTLTSIGIASTYGRRGFGTAVGSEFLTDFAKSGGLMITLGESLVDDLSLDGSAAALVVFERCRRELSADLAHQRRERERLAHIPVNPFAAIRPEAVPVPTPPRDPVPQGSWATRILENYPARAIRDELQGTVGISLVVSAQGRVLSCAVTSTSGHAILDEAACDGAQRYGRFEPALDHKGQPTEGTFATVIRYSLGGG